MDRIQVAAEAYPWRAANVGITVWTTRGSFREVPIIEEFSVARRLQV
jgi:hypothetical protein